MKERVTVVINVIFAKENDQVKEQTKKQERFVDLMWWMISFIESNRVTIAHEDEPKTNKK